MLAPGASVVVGQVTVTAGPAGDTSWSATVRPCSVTCPELCTVKVKVISSPTPARWSLLASLVIDADLTRVSPGVSGVGVVVVDGGVTTGGPVGGVPDAVAELSTDPASTSAWVTTYTLEVHTRVAPGASTVAGQVTLTSGPAGATSWSSTATLWRVTLPVFFIVKVKVI